MRKILFIILLLLILPSVAYARIGVGVGTGKIVVDQKLKPGLIYKLPPLTVVNTGDIESDYKVGVTYHEKQRELPPPEDWFIFSPKEFHLVPGKVQVVDIKLNLPVNAKPGDYFAYLEGQPMIKAKSGATTIAVAAAAKLYFTVVPANIFQAIYYKVLSFWIIYQPWTGRAAILLGVIVIYTLFKKFFNVQINMKDKSRRNPKDDKDE